MWKVTLLVLCLVNLTNVLAVELEGQASQSKEQNNVILLINYLTIDSRSIKGKNSILDNIEKVRESRSVVAELVFGALEPGVDSETREPFIAKTSKGLATVLKQALRIMEESDGIHEVFIIDPLMSGSSDEYEDIRRLKNKIENFYNHKN